jgi:hypothetical protein
VKPARNSDLKQPLAQWEEVDVTFSSTANADTLVEHHLEPANPDAVYYIPVRKDRVAQVYHDTSVTRKSWQNGFILLRSDVASARMTLLLFTTHSVRTLPF